MEMPRFTAAPWTASLTTGRHLVGGALHIGVVSAVALEARCTRAFHVSAASAAMLRTSQSGRRVSREGSVAIGRCACGRGTEAPRPLQGYARTAVHGWANGRAASKQSNDGVAGTQWWYTSMLWASSADGSMRHGRTTALSYALRGRGGHNEPAQAPLRALGRHCLCRCVRWLLRRNATRWNVQRMQHARCCCCRAARMPARSRRGPWRRRAGPRIPARFALGLAML
jgi:hypothetical protein